MAKYNVPSAQGWRRRKGWQGVNSRSTTIHARPVNASALREAAERVEDAGARREASVRLAASERKEDGGAAADAVSFSSSTPSSAAALGRRTAWRRRPCRSTR